MEDQNLRSLFESAERARKDVESSWDSNTATYQENLAAAITSYESCLKLADRLSLFSPNETLEDISTGDLQYLLTSYHLGNLLLRTNSSSRKDVLQAARTAYERYISLLDHYEVLSAPDKKLYTRYTESPQTFSTISTTDPNARRDAKIANFRTEKELKKKLEFLQRNPAYLQNDEDAVREIRLADIALCTHNTFQSLESINREEDVLALAPPPSESLSNVTAQHDNRGNARSADKDGYSERLDIHSILGNGSKNGPILDSKGKPLQPFTLLGDRNDRQTVQSGVFRTGHNLPTMTIDEYLEEERQRGGIIEGGGEQSGQSQVVDEDDYEKGEEETMKARAWDEYVEANPKGSGNTLNRG